MASMKNAMLSPAASSLGLSDPLDQQVQDADEEAKRKKKLAEQMMQRGTAQMGPATMALFGQ